MKSKIFISSTCFDLIDLRAEVFHFLKDAGLTPLLSDQVDSDFLTFHDRNSIETCLINLRESDIVIIILSQRYGPTLEKAGFEPISATHLEYREAIKENKRILMFVRDRLEAEFNIYLKTGDASSFSWIKEKDVQIFELLKTHKQLVDNNRNNWYWTFRNSIEIKRRLEIELKVHVAEIRLNDLIKSGNIPFVTIDVEISHMLLNRGIQIKVYAENLGSHPAIEPFVIIYSAADYDEVLEFEQSGRQIENYYSSISSLQPYGRSKPMEFQFLFNNQRQNSGIHHFFVEVRYKNTLGDELIDITKIDAGVVRTTQYQKFEVSKSFIAKRIGGYNCYQQIVTE